MFGQYEKLLQELNREDRKSYKNFLRMDADMIGELVAKVGPREQKQGTKRASFVSFLLFPSGTIIIASGRGRGTSGVSWSG